MREIPVVKSNCPQKIGRKRTTDGAIGTRRKRHKSTKSNDEKRKSTIFDSTEAYGITSRGKFTFFNNDALSTRLWVAEVIDDCKSVQGSSAA